MSEFHFSEVTFFQNWYFSAFFQNSTVQNLVKMYLCALNHLALCTWAAETENYNQMRGIDDGTHHTVTSRLVLRFFQCPLNSEKP